MNIQFDFNRGPLAAAAVVKREVQSMTNWTEMDELINKAGFVYQLLRLAMAETHRETLERISERLRVDEYAESDIEKVVDKLNRSAEDWLEETILDSALAGGWDDELPEEYDDLDELLEMLPANRRLQLIQALQALV